ncbi:hypothetical protein PQX77_015377, partial [Marasmius sp. AFHP31]
DKVFVITVKYLRQEFREAAVFLAHSSLRYYLPASIGNGENPIHPDELMGSFDPDMLPSGECSWISSSVDWCRRVAPWTKPLARRQHEGTYALEYRNSNDGSIEREPDTLEPMVLLSKEISFLRIRFSIRDLRYVSSVLLCLVPNFEAKCAAFLIALPDGVQPVWDASYFSRSHGYTIDTTHLSNSTTVFGNSEWFLGRGEDGTPAPHTTTINVHRVRTFNWKMSSHSGRIPVL